MTASPRKELQFTPYNLPIVSLRDASHTFSMLPLVTAIALEGLLPVADVFLTKDAGVFYRWNLLCPSLPGGSMPGDYHGRLLVVDY